MDRWSLISILFLILVAAWLVYLLLPEEVRYLISVDGLQELSADISSVEEGGRLSRGQLGQQISGLEIEATVQALVDEIVAVRLGQGTAQASSLEPTPSATPVPYSPTRSDFDIAKLAMVPDDASSARGLIEIGFVFDEYAATYVGMECVNNEEPSRERFRSFVTLSVSNWFQSVPPVASASGIASKLAEAMQVQIRQGKSPVQRECMRPFAFPVSDQDVDLAWGLIKGADGTTAFNPFSSYLNNALKRNFYQWFDSEESKGKPLIVWWCDPTVHTDTC